MKRADVIIPSYRPDIKLAKLVSRLMEQSIIPEKIIIINTGESIWNELEAGEMIYSAVKAEQRESLKSRLIIRHIDKMSFNHGATRNLGVSLSESEYFICMTQDALPADRKLIENLLKDMGDEIRLSYARQLPNADANPVERFTRMYNYPASDLIKSEKDRGRLGIKLYFASNVCAAYEREIFERLGGFAEHAVLNEDMLYAAALMRAGFSCKYCAGARVFHSHNFSGVQQFKRNFDIAVSQVQNPGVFSGFVSESEGIRLVRLTAAWLIKRREIMHLPFLVYISACKYLGFRLGRMYKKLPPRIIKKLSSNKAYWERENV